MAISRRHYGPHATRSLRLNRPHKVSRVDLPDRLRTRLSLPMKKLLVAMAVAAAILLTAGSATAAPTRNGQAQAAAPFTFVAIYPTDQDCLNAGFIGLAGGRWTDFRCVGVSAGVELWVHFSQPGPAPDGVYIRGTTSFKCIEVQFGFSTNGTPLRLWPCLSNHAPQRWIQHSDGSLRALGKCMDILNQGTQNGAPIVLWDCNGGDNQKWESINVNGSNRMLRNPRSGRCLDTVGSSPADGTRIQLWDCVASPGQQWTFVAPSLI